ncbi:MAG TPA: HEAT repeat domain-containing protein [Candidatus Acidoferrales bacterium]|jgi:HEAT repeat protein|nr:HEAT repeat domain-containing protein [Candidatus Acidoferrales bacterium]
MDSVLAVLLHLKSMFRLSNLLLIFPVGTAFLIVLLMARRAWRVYREQRYDAVSFKIHGQWRNIVRGEIPPHEWRNNSLKIEILQSIVIGEINGVTDKDRAGLQKFLRESGLLSRCIERVLNESGWAKRHAMLDLGSMRVPEGIDSLVETLDDWQLDTRITAVRALGLTGLPEAAGPILEAHMVGGLKVPTAPIADALMRCFNDRPEALLPYLRRSMGESRVLLARVAGELSTPQMADEIIILAEDPEPEIRASAARALAALPLPLAIPVLAKLIRDDAWFVRLRATSSLNQILHPRVIPILLEAIRDPHRLVRIRAASALAKFEHETMDILQSVVDSRDKYALHAMISALDLGGGFGNVLALLADPEQHNEAAASLLDALRKGAAGLWTMKPADPAVEAVFP